MITGGVARSMSTTKGNGKYKGKKTAGEKEFLCLYVFFFSAMAIAYQSGRNLGLSTFITLAVALQFLAYSVLTLKVIQQQSVRGISAKSLKCHAAVYCSRLSCTTWLKGYIPTDFTGNWLYQTTDAMCLAMVVCLLYFVLRRYRHSYQEEQDTFEIGYLLSGCFVLAVLLHPHLNSRPMFDTLWTFALYVHMFAMMPQLWMIAKLSGELGDGLEILNAHYVAAIAASHGVSLVFWIYGFREFAPKDGGFNTTGWAIMGAHIIQCMLLLDFMFCYVKAYVCACVKTRAQATLPSIPTTPPVEASFPEGSSLPEEASSDSLAIESSVSCDPVSV